MFSQNLHLLTQRSTSILITPTEHKLAAFRFLYNRMDPLPPAPSCKQKEENTVLRIAKANGFLHALLTKLHTHKSNTQTLITTYK